MRGRRQGTLVMDVGPRDHVQGPADAPVTLLEYGDYQCPFCGAAHPVVKALQRFLLWEMHDTLFQNQPELDYESLLGYAEELALDLERFATELDNHVYEPRVREDFIGGVLSGVNGTPTYFINGVRHEGSFDFETMLAAIQARMTNLAA